MSSVSQNSTTRRWFLAATTLIPAGIATAWYRKANPEIPAASLPSPDHLVTIIQFSDAGTNLGPVHLATIHRADADWWSQLTPQQYYVTRQRQTDQPFSGTYFQLHASGLYRCICCQTALFSADAKFDSGTGWPSFSAPIAPENVRRILEPGVSLTSGIEVRCTLCDAHLGHIFNDGPAPTHLRYCINESSLLFAPA